MTTRPPRELWPEAVVDSFIASLTLIPIQKSFDYKDPQTKNGINFHWLGNSIARSGIPSERLKDTVSEYRMPKFVVNLDDDCMAHLLRFSIYGDEPTIARYHSIEMQGNNLMLRLHRIAASLKHMATLTDAQMDALEARAASLISERDKGFVDRFNADKRLKDMSASVAAAGDDVEKQLGLLAVQGQNILLPPQQFKLSQYAEIKNRMLKAGGKYSANKALGSYFAFPMGYNVPEILETLQQGSKINVKKETQFFATPKDRVKKAADTLGNLRGKYLLEPSAGDGAMADEAVARGADVVTIENWGINAQALRDKGYNPMEKDFLEVSPEDTGLFDAVLMNPPFTKGQDMKHIRHALSFLRTDGKMTAIMSKGFETNVASAAQSFRQIVEIGQAKVDQIPSGEFKESGTSIATVQISMDMADLLEGLSQRAEDGSEYGLDLSRQWEIFSQKASQRQEASHAP